MSNDLIREYVMADARVRVLSDKYGDSAKPKEFWDVQQERRLLAYRIADELDPPAKIDTTLRGWVLWTRSNDDDMRFVMWAAEDGLKESPDSLRPMFIWEEFEGRSEPLVPLTPEDIGFKVRKWDEWSEEERRKWVDTWGGYAHSGDAANYAIEIATRQEDV